MSFQIIRDQLKLLKRNFVSREEYQLALGPCAVESDAQIDECARAAKRAGATYLRGGAIKLRTSHRSFEGLGASAWETLSKAARAQGLLAVSEVTNARDIVEASRWLDAVQIGARCMWNFDLLEAAANCGREVVLKRGMGASTREWLAAAERLQVYGCKSLVLCERGDRGHDGVSRNSIDISVLAFLADEACVPIWLDVSHSSGDPDVAIALLRRAEAFGLNGAMAEIHPNPESARCDREQAIPTARICEICPDPWKYA